MTDISEEDLDALQAKMAMSAGIWGSHANGERCPTFSRGDCREWAERFGCADAAITALRAENERLKSDALEQVAGAYLAAEERLAMEQGTLITRRILGTINALTPADAIAALEARDARVRAEVMAAGQVRYRIRWVAAPRPPAHPEPMNGTMLFKSMNDVAEFFDALATDAKLVAVEKTTMILTIEDVTDTLHTDASRKAGGE